MLENDIELEQICELYACLKSSMTGFRSAATQKKLNPPSFTLTEFVRWAIKQDDYPDVIQTWRHSGYHKQFRPKMKIINLHKDRYSLANFAMSSYDILQGQFNQGN